MIQNADDIFKTRRVACIVENDQLHIIIIGSPAKSLLSRIFYEKTRLRPDMGKERAIVKKDRCLIPRRPEVLDLMNSDLFILVAKTFVDFVLTSSSIMTGFFRNQMWISRKPIFEFNLVTYYNGDKPRIGKE